MTTQQSQAPRAPEVPDPRDLDLWAGEDDAGLRLDLFLARELKVSRGTVRRLLRDAAVLLDQRLAGLPDKGTLLEAGSRVEVRAFTRPADERATADPKLPLPLLAQGDGWLAVDKAAGIPVHPLRPGEGGTVLGAVMARYPQVHGVGEGGLRSGIVHRLDVDTSGITIVATQEATWARLRNAFRQHRVAKRYRAVVAGSFEAEARIELPLVVASHRPARVRVLEHSGRHGRPWIALQRVCPVEALPGATLVEVELETGFLHQIRATLAHLGHPVLGDKVYGDRETALVAEAPRQLLHAAHLCVDEIDVHSPDPDDLASVLRALRARR